MGPSAIKYAPNTLPLWKLVVGHFHNNVDIAGESGDVHLDGRTTIVTRVRTRGPLAFLLQANGPPSVAGRLQLQLLLAEILLSSEIIFHVEDEESDRGEGETADAEEGYHVSEGRGERRRRGEVRLGHCG